MNSSITPVYGTVSKAMIWVTGLAAFKWTETVQVKKGEKGEVAEEIVEIVVERWEIETLTVIWYRCSKSDLWFPMRGLWLVTHWDSMNCLSWENVGPIFKP